MDGAAFVDHYETLQISPNADLDTVHRVYRILAQRYHPDNAETGNAEMFRAVSEAYRALGDAEKRAAYDVQHRENRRLSWRIFNQANSTQGVEGEKQKRDGILALLYRKRMMDPEQPWVTLREFEDLLGVPKEHLEFSLWYLREAQCIHRSDNGRHTITLRGVEVAEAAQLAPHAPFRAQPVLMGAKTA